MVSRHVSIVIGRSPREVYDFAADPQNLPRWAAGLAESDIRREGSKLVTDSPMGRVTFAFVAPNDLGVLDHEVHLPSGEVVYNPLRVLRHPDGAEVVFTLRQLGMSDEEFARDTALVEQDLQRLAMCLEG